VTRMERKNGPWTIRKSEIKYENGHFTVQEDEVTRPDGKPGAYATIHMPPGVGVIAVDDAGNAHLAKQFRYGLGRDSIEIVAGSMENGETPLDAAKRELKEELGIEAKEWTPLGTCDMDTSIVVAPMHLFLARGLSFTEPEREGTVSMPLEQAVQMVMTGEITHAPSGVLLFKAQQVTQADPTHRQRGPSR
jgi:8-oxo-dGTP pyrophosphatase MutT (NUDIX family)